MFDHILSLTIKPLFVGCCQLECNIQEIFPFEMTIVQTTCTGCGVTNAIGELAVYMHGMGTIIRCPSCDSVIIRVVQAKGHYWLDMRGVRVLQINTEI